MSSSPRSDGPARLVFYALLPPWRPLGQVRQLAWSGKPSPVGGSALPRRLNHSGSLLVTPMGHRIEIVIGFADPPLISEEGINDILEIPQQTDPLVPILY